MSPLQAVRQGRRFQWRRVDVRDRWEKIALTKRRVKDLEIRRHERHECGHLGFHHSNHKCFFSSKTRTMKRAVDYGSGEATTFIHRVPDANGKTKIKWGLGVVSVGLILVVGASLAVYGGVSEHADGSVVQREEPAILTLESAQTGGWDASEMTPTEESDESEPETTVTETAEGSGISDTIYDDESDATDSFAVEQPTSPGSSTSGSQWAPWNVSTSTEVPEVSFLDGFDWNLLAPSHETIHDVNRDDSSEVTLDEMLNYLSDVKSREQDKFFATLYKYDATIQCLKAGLKSFVKTSVSVDEYHVLVQWMYSHCVLNETKQLHISLTEEETGSDGEVHPHMTKLEFYYKIRDHFMGERSELLGNSEAAQLRSTVATNQRAKLLACIEQATGRFETYEQPERLRSAVTWIQDECLHT